MKKIFILLVALAMIFNGKSQDSNIDVEQFLNTTLSREEVFIEK